MWNWNRRDRKGLPGHSIYREDIWDGEKRRHTRHDDICSPFRVFIILWLHGVVRVQGGSLRIGLSQQVQKVLVKVPAYVESHLLFSQLFKAYILPKVYTEQRSYLFTYILMWLHPAATFFNAQWSEPMLLRSKRFSHVYIFLCFLVIYKSKMQSL